MCHNTQGGANQQISEYELVWCKIETMGIPQIRIMHHATVSIRSIYSRRLFFGYF